MAAGPRCWLSARTSISHSAASLRMWSMSPTRTSRAGLARAPLEVVRLISHALEACSRVLKKRAAQSHLSMRVPVMRLFYGCKGKRLNTDDTDGYRLRTDHGFQG